MSANTLGRRILSIALTGALAACSSNRATPHQTAADYDAFDFAHRRVDSAAIYALSLNDARIVRGIVFGRHGRPFDDDTDIRTYLANRPWYQRDSTFTNARLNETERVNLDIIRGAEAAKHPFVQPGDLRYHRDRPVTVAMIGHHTLAEWELLTAELPALYGYRFYEGDPKAGGGEDFDDEQDDERALQEYFNERYWYKAATVALPRYTPTELALLDTLKLARMLDAGLAVAPGMMYLFEKTPMVDSVLRGVSIYDLRLLRNEVFARHGRRFTTPWLKEYFEMQPWYKPRADFTIKELSDVERANIVMITARESAFHESLATTRLSESAFDGLYPDDARKLRDEIYARHGRVFEDPKTQAYFASLPWYRADPGFKDESLNDVERSNVDAITKYEGRARTGMRFYAA